VIKRLFDIVASLIGLVATSPIQLTAMLAIWLQDFHSPLYVADRAGIGGRPFRMVKLRSMVIRADTTGVDSTSGSDSRITAVGHLIRRYKLDELSQLWNVLKGDMSIVGPRPNVGREIELYTDTERHLLDLRPGITDIASIVFSDEGDILSDSSDPDLDYNRLIRPWKSRLGLLYVEQQSQLLDMKLIFLTAIAILSRARALEGLQRVLEQLGADEQLKTVARRTEALEPYPPPGATDVVDHR
jgi:lipopolysaccharide/colanic/teichoic acid biosynthesis glycosyltransferase